MSPSLGELARFALLGFASVSNALAIAPNAASASPYEGLALREYKRADGTVGTIYENRAVQFVEESDAEQSARLAKRVAYSTYTGPGRNDYCGESDPTTSAGASAPLAADCSAIALAYSNAANTDAVKGYWTVLASNFAAAPGGWVTLAASGTCKFPIQIPYGPLQTVYFGTNDLRFYTNYAVLFASGGHIQAQGTVECNNNTAYVEIGVNYALTHS